MNNAPINDLGHVVKHEGIGYAAIDVIDHLAGKVFDVAKAITARVFSVNKK